MFGWEFPPYASGGLGTACYGLTKGLVKNNLKVIFVMPRLPKGAKADFVKLIAANNKDDLNIKEVSTIVQAYMTPDEYEEKLFTLFANNQLGTINMYGKNLFAEVMRYSENAKRIALSEDFDIIHAHDWMTYKAGIMAKKVSNKKLVVHVHATEFDRTGGNGVNQYVYDLEKEGMHAADSVIAVSNFTKEKIINHYGVPAEKIHVVHNAVEQTNHTFNKEDFGIKKNNKVILFLGRVTLQKGPDYFIETAKKVLEVEPNVTFIVAGTGDMTNRIIERAASLGIADKVLFTGFLTGPEIDKAYQMADVYLMPSVSEPFGITPLESMRNKTPVIISKQSGVSEVIQNCLKADFWDINRMANQIVGMLRYPEVHKSLQEEGFKEIQKISWDEPARKCIDIYNKLRGAN
jgi:glycosyltransferase involved in cell wall biosynthesis